MPVGGWTGPTKSSDIRRSTTTRLWCERERKQMPSVSEGHEYLGVRGRSSWRSLRSALANDFGFHASVGS